MRSATRKSSSLNTETGAIAQQWTDIEVVDLTSCSRAALRGRRPKSVRTLNANHAREKLRGLPGRYSARRPVLPLGVSLHCMVRKNPGRMSFCFDSEAPQVARRVSRTRRSPADISGHQYRRLVDRVLQDQFGDSQATCLTLVRMAV